MTSSHHIMSISLFPDSMVPRPRDDLNIFLYASYRLFDWSVRPGTYSIRHRLGMRLLDVCNTSYICPAPTGVFRCSDKNDIILFVICIE